MDKKIILKMQPSKDILLSVEGGNTIAISKNDRKLKANDVYRLLNFSRGNKYTVESENEENVDAPVLKFFEELITDIVKKLNRITDSDEDEFLSETEIDDES